MKMPTSLGSIVYGQNDEKWCIY